LKNQKIAALIKWVVVIAIPFFLTTGTLRLIITWDSPSYPEFEYARIPPDQFGFSDNERLQYAATTLDYLRRPESADQAIGLLEEMTLPDGESPLYNQREIGHMLDVKNVVDSIRILFWVLAVVVVGGLIFLLLRPETRGQGYKAIMFGGALTTGVLLIMVILILISWNFVFTQFHEVLFPPDTWTFFYTDSLIRLFPEQFWFDFGLLWTGLIFIEGLLLMLLGYFLQRRIS
jgi:integral membrane protein (TIGR01906 family)